LSGTDLLWALVLFAVGDIECKSRLGGLLKHCHRKAA
jgi:hypothetical protein